MASSIATTSNLPTTKLSIPLALSGDSTDRDGVWIPPTPAKQIPTDFGLHWTRSKEFSCIGSFNATGYLERNGKNEMYELEAGVHEHDPNPKNTAAVREDTSCVQQEAVKVPPSECDGKKANGVHEHDRTLQQDTSCVQEEAVKVPPSECDSKKANGVHDSPVGIGSVPSPETKDSRKRRNDGSDMNKKPSQRPRVKKHRPKILDDSKPKKVPKAQTPRASTPRPKTPKPATPRQVRERRKQVRKNTFTESTSCMQNSTSYDHKVVQEVQAAPRDSIIDVKSCKRSLNFDYHLVDKESHHVPKSDEQAFNSDVEKFDYFRKVVTSKRNTQRRSRFEKKCFKSSEDSLGDNIQQRQQDNSVFEDQERAETHVRRYGKVYQRRKKSSSKATTFIPVLQVYQRRFRDNDCEKNSRKSGPIFPRMFKKQRAKRKKVAMKENWWYNKDVGDGKSHVRRSPRKLIKITRKGVDNGVKKSNLRNDEKFLGVFSPNKRKRSTRRTRKRENMMNLFQQEENFLKIRECIPLQEVPVHGIQSFTSLQPDAQPFDNSKCLQLTEVPVFDGESLQLSSKEYSNNLYADEMTVYITRKLEQLDISGICKEIVVRDHNVSGAIVKIDPPKKRKVLPKVELDEETLRVWKLLMENDGSKPVEETDTDKEEWWERQRKVFRGRVDSFIAKMHLIQGNRRFSPWKGSVVDSVVGVYLTQNVSDHLSSSAFMSLAARFPVKSRSKEVDDHGEMAKEQDMTTSCADEIDQKTGTTCAEAGDETSTTKAGDLNPILDELPTMKLEEKGVSNPILAHDKPCVGGNSNSFRKLLDKEVVDYLKQFYSSSNNESPLNKSRVNGDSNANKEDKEQSAASCGLPISREPCATIPDLNEGLCETSGEVVVEDNGGNEHLERSENEFIVQVKATPEGGPEMGAPECLLQSDVTMEKREDAVNIQQSMKAIPLDTENTRKKKSKIEEKQAAKVDWESLRRTYCKTGGKETNENNMDAVDWDAVRRATVQEIAETIVERGMNNVLAARIKEFLERMVKDHGTIDLEWLRDVPPDKAKEFLLSIQGIGLKSVECVRLLTLHHLAFPVDTNVGRVATRLGWVPLQPLPEEVQIHLLNSYPMVDTIQKYLFPRLCTLDQRTLYELHYQLITFGKVFCTKRNPNCNACPMRAECRHYASAFASARLALPGPKESSVTSIVPVTNEHSVVGTLPSVSDLEVSNLGSSYHAKNSEPIIEVPPSPEPEVGEASPICDIEDYFCESDDEIPTIRLNTEEFRETLKETIDVNSIPLPEADVSKALVALTKEAAYIPAPRMKFIGKLRTVHYVYELPDTHPSLVGFDKREEDDPSPYLLAIWLSECTEENRACNPFNIDEEETVKGTVLIPCRTANRGKFPLNGTYFQVNEVFADDETSKVPMDVPRCTLWTLPRRHLGCGTSATSIFKALSTSDIQRCFWRGSICVRGFNRKTRQPRPLHRRFHISTSAFAADRKK